MSTTLAVFTPHNAEPAPTPAQLDTRNYHPVLDFDDTTNETMYFSAVMPQIYGNGNVVVYIYYCMESDNSNTVDWDVAFERMPEDGMDIDSDNFAAVNSADNCSVPDVVGEIDVASISFTAGADMDSVIAGDAFRISLTRDASSDDASDDAEVLFVEIRES